MLQHQLPVALLVDAVTTLLSRPRRYCPINHSINLRHVINCADDALSLLALLEISSFFPPADQQQVRVKLQGLISNASNDVHISMVKCFET